MVHYPAMNSPRVYFDYSATTPLDPEVLEAMAPFWTQTFGNASSVHAYGRAARQALDEGREAIVRAIGASFDEIFFTGGGTEADNHALRGVMRTAIRAGKLHLITCATEHHAVLHVAERLRQDGIETTILGVDERGLVEVSQIEKSIRPATALVSIMHANNETGVLQQINEIGRIAREHEVLFHSDVVQSFGKIPIDVKSIPVDLLSLSAHKIYGPKGIGAIFIRKGTKIEPLLVGGAQESNRRAGTESVPLAVGFAKAVELSLAAMESESARLAQLKSQLKSKLREGVSGLLFNGDGVPALANILNVSFNSRVRPVDGEALIMGMDLCGVAVTSGSACTSGSLQPSHVLLAMGRDEVTARATIRFSMGRFTTEEEIEVAVKAVERVLQTAAMR